MCMWYFDFDFCSNFVGWERNAEVKNDADNGMRGLGPTTTLPGLITSVSRTSFPSNLSCSPMDPPHTSPLSLSLSSLLSLSPSLCLLVLVLVFVLAPVFLLVLVLLFVIVLHFLLVIGLVLDLVLFLFVLALVLVLVLVLVLFLVLVLLLLVRPGLLDLAVACTGDVLPQS